MEKRCVNYVGLACVDGSCPAAENEFRDWKSFNCQNCYCYQGCTDCALAGTELCKEEFFHSGKE